MEAKDHSSQTVKLQDNNKSSSDTRKKSGKVQPDTDQPDNEHQQTNAGAESYPVYPEEHEQENAEDETNEPKTKQSDIEFKVFVGGLTGDTNNEDLKEYFKNHVDVIDAFVVTDTVHKKPSGFGFVTVKSREDMDKLISIKHQLKGSAIDCKEALNKFEAKEKECEERKRKLFVGGLPKNLKDDLLQEYFSAFGKVQKAYVVKDFKNGNTRGFGFIIFDTMEGYYKALNSSKPHTIYGKEIHVRETQSRKEEKERHKQKPKGGYGESEEEEKEQEEDEDDEPPSQPSQFKPIPNSMLRSNKKNENSSRNLKSNQPVNYQMQQPFQQGYMAAPPTYLTSIPEGYMAMDPQGMPAQQVYSSSRPIHIGGGAGLRFPTNEEVYYVAAPQPTSNGMQFGYPPQAYYKFGGPQYYQPMSATNIPTGMAPIQYAQSGYYPYGGAMPMQIDPSYRVIPTYSTYTIPRGPAQPYQHIANSDKQILGKTGPSKQRTSKQNSAMKEHSKNSSNNMMYMIPQPSSNMSSYRQVYPNSLSKGHILSQTGHKNTGSMKKAVTKRGHGKNKPSIHTTNKNVEPDELLKSDQEENEDYEIEKAEDM